MKTKHKITAVFIGFIVALISLGCEGKTAKQRCLEQNTKTNPDQYQWVPERGTLNSHLTPDEVGQCSVKVGVKG